MKLTIPVSKHKMEEILSLSSLLGMVGLLIFVSILMIVKFPYPSNFIGIFVLSLSLLMADDVFHLCIFSRLKKLNPFQFKDN